MTDRIAEVSPRFKARMAGVFQLLEGLTATYGEVIVLGKVVVAGNAAAPCQAQSERYRCKDVPVVAACKPVGPTLRKSLASGQANVFYAKLGTERLLYMRLQKIDQNPNLGSRDDDSPGKKHDRDGPRKLALEIFELEEFHPSSQKRKEWLPGLDSN
jgi:hypothetical protein